MTKSLQIYWAVFAITALLAILGTLVPRVGANPSFVAANSTASCTTMSVTGTTTVAYMTAGNATTTVCLNAALGSNATAMFDSATLVLYRNAVSTLTQTKVQLEYSNNCSVSSPDWVADRVSLDGFGATTTSALGFSAPNSINWVFASSTLGGATAPNYGGGGFGTTSPDTIIIPIKTPVQCVRAILTVPPGMASSSIWGELIGKRQER